MNELLEKALVNAIKKLDKTEQQIIILRYFKEMTQVKIAEPLGLSQVQVSRLENIEKNQKQFGCHKLINHVNFCMYCFQTWR